VGAQIPALNFQRCKGTTCSLRFTNVWAIFLGFFFSPAIVVIVVMMSFVKIEREGANIPHYNINKKFIYIYSEPVPPLPMFILTNDHDHRDHGK
jgi:hypothetical protein